MGTRARLLKNTIALSAPAAVNPFISFALIMVISRRLGAQGLGEYSLILSWQAIFASIASLGLGALIIRETARRPETIHSFFVNSLIFGLVSSLIAMISMIMIVKLLDYPHRIMVGAAISSLSLFPSTSVRYVEAIFRSTERSEYLALCYMLENIARVLISVILLLLGFDLLWVFAAITFSSFATFALMMFFYAKIVGIPKWSCDWAIWKLMFRQSPTFLSIAIFSTLHLSMPEIILSKLMDIESVGIFSAAAKIVGFATVIPIGFCMALLPAMTKKYEHGIDKLKQMTSDSIRYGFIFIFPIVIGTTLLSGQIIQTIFGPKFEMASPVLSMMVFGMIPYFLLVTLAQVLVSTDNQHYDLRVNLIAVIVSFSLLMALIPIFGVIGSTMATLSCFTILNQVQYRFIKKQLFVLDFWAICSRPLVGAVFMAPVTLLLTGHNLVVNILGSAIFYGAIIILIGGLTREEFSNLLNTFRKKTA